MVLGQKDPGEVASPGVWIASADRRCAKTMVVLSFMIASAFGLLAGLGVGGGSLLILYLTLALNTPVNEARTINLLFFLASAGAVSIFRLRCKSISIKKLLPAIITGCLGSTATALISRGIDTQILSRIFAWLLILTGLRELFYRPRKAR